MPSSLRTAACAGLSTALGLLAACSSTAPSAPKAGSLPASSSAPATPAYQVVNLMPAFEEFWAQAKSKDMPTQATLFGQLLADRYPEVYNRDVLGGPPDVEFTATLPKRYPAVQARIAPKMEVVLRLGRQIGSDLPRYEANFRKTFPGLDYSGRIYFLYSLGAFDGGTRTVKGQLALLFGLDMMAYVYGEEANPEPFFHHELFHIYHSQFSGEGGTLAAALWREGLATYAAHVLNPTAAGVNLFGLPRNTPERTRAELPRYVRAMRAVLDSEKKDDYARYFLGGMDEQAETPARSGYYIGYLVAEKLARRHTLLDLARAQLGQLRPEIDQALQELEQAAVAKP